MTNVYAIQSTECMDFDGDEFTRIDSMDPAHPYYYLFNYIIFGQFDKFKQEYESGNEQGCPWNASVCVFAAKHGNLACLQYLHEHGCPWNNSVYNACANSISCLQYAHENGCPRSKTACYRAVLHDNLNCLIYLHEHDMCPKNSTYLCKLASDLGSLQCLRFAHENDYPWDSSCCDTTYVDCLRYAHENGCPWIKDDMLVHAWYADTVECMTYAHEHGCEFNKNVMRRIKNDLTHLPTKVINYMRVCGVIRSQGHLVFQS